MILLLYQLIQFSTIVIPKISFSNDYICIIKLKMKKLVLLGSIMAAMAVVFGAFGAHALKALLSTTQLQSYETGVKYHLVHSLGMILIAILYHQTKIKLFKTAGMLMFIGLFLFSFSIYLLATKDLFGISSWTFLGPITPMGGLLLISAWVLIFIGAFNIKND